MKLWEHAESDGLCQFGEYGVLRQIFNVIGVEHATCCEAGAFDGLDCSNTAYFWRDRGWAGHLIEADAGRYLALTATVSSCATQHSELVLSDGPRGAAVMAQRYVRDGGDLTTIHEAISPDTVNALVPADCDLFSLDIDGDEIFVLQAMTVRPRVLVVEFNQSIPWWMDVHPINPGGCVGSSASALVRVCEGLGYVLTEAVGCNLLFVHRDAMPDLTPLGSLCAFRKAPEILADWNEREKPLTYLATDYRGRPFMLGGPPPWGLLEERCTETLCETEHG